jgi:hypothetical protein
MATQRRNLVGLLLAGAAAACFPGREAARAQETPSGTSGGLVGAWRVAALRVTGNGVNLLTFTSDGTFFRSGDTHPVLSVGHGVWAPTGDRGDFDANYIAWRFDQSGAYIGSQQTRIRITVGSDPDQFAARTKTSTVALDGTVLDTREGQLQGQRIKLEPFDG